VKATKNRHCGHTCIRPGSALEGTRLNACRPLVQRAWFKLGLFCRCDSYGADYEFIVRMCGGICAPVRSRAAPGDLIKFIR